MSENSGHYSSGSPDDTGEFFSVGAPLHAVRPGYVRRIADDTLYETLVSGAYAHLIAPDRTGKSSLIAATSARLQNNGTKVAVIDLAQISERDGGTDAGRWYYSIAYRLLRQLRLKIDLQAWWQDKSFLSNRQRLVEFYVEIILQNISERIVIFIDEIQCVAEHSFARHLLASIRSAHNARITEPDFSRLSFVLVGECDPATLEQDANISPFSITRPIHLNDFTRADLELFASELNLSAADAKAALDQIYYWTDGQPYLSQKLARAVARAQLSGNIEARVDRIAMHQLAGRAAFRNEPHMSHIHRRVTGDRRHCEALLNLYGRIRKGVDTGTDLGSPLQRQLMAVGLIVGGEDGNLKIRNRLYERVFTARWANENLPLHWRGPAIAAGLLLVFIAAPFWYTQLLPRPYVRAMSSLTVEIDTAVAAYRNLQTFPGHSESADRLIQIFLRNRALLADDPATIAEIEELSRNLPVPEGFSDNLVADFWDRQVAAALRVEDRDIALLAALEALAVSTPKRRRRAASLVGDDYSQLIATLRVQATDRFVFNPDQVLVTYASGAQIRQWSLASQKLVARDPWIISALEITPLVRRVVVDREGRVSRVGLSINVSHSRLGDLHVKLIAPSGRTVDLSFDQTQSAANDVIRFGRSELSAFNGETLKGTWSLSVRDERTGATGHLIAWNLSLNSQVVVENFERGLDIPEPLVRESSDLWFSPDGRYAIARAVQSDSARLWDLAFAQAVRTLAVPANERLLGLSSDAQYVLTVAQQTVKLWNTASGKLRAELPIATNREDAIITEDGEHVLVRRRGETDTEFELWSLETAAVKSRLSIAGSAALVATDASGSRLAVADYDRAVRVWNLNSGELMSHLDFWAQPSEIDFAAAGEVLGVVHGDQGVSLWRVGQPETPLIFERRTDDWQMAISQGGAKVLAGSPRQGFQVYRSSDGAMLGSPVGSGNPRTAIKTLAFSSDEQHIITADEGGAIRFWSAPLTPAVSDDSLASEPSPGHHLLRESGDSVAAMSPGGNHLAIGDGVGHVHILRADADAEELAQTSDELSFLGHRGAVVALAFSGDGALVASAGLDQAIRVWDTGSGLPRPFHVRTLGSAIDQIGFSPAGGRLAVLGGHRLWVIDTENGTVLADIELGEPHFGLAFAADDQLYVGGESGTLRSVTRDRTGNWNFRNLWQGQAPVRKIGISPNGRRLVIVDARHVAQVLYIESGRIGSYSLTLAEAVADILFSPSESRILFRTARWIHKASISPSGLNWLDAIRSPKALAGSRMVFDRRAQASAVDGDPLGDRVILLTRDAGFAEVAELSFAFDRGPALFGSKDQLLREWRSKLGVVEE